MEQKSVSRRFKTEQSAKPWRINIFEIAAFAFGGLAMIFLIDSSAAPSTTLRAKGLFGMTPQSSCRRRLNNSSTGLGGHAGLELLFGRPHGVAPTIREDTWDRPYDEFICSQTF